MKNNKFIKRILSSLVALTMIFTLIPAAFVSAAETDETYGSYWETISVVTMDDYEATTGIGGGYSYYSGKKSDNTGYAYAQAGTGKYSLFKGSKGAQRIHQGTGLRTISDEGTNITSMPQIPGVESITNIFKMNRAWSNQSGSWDAGQGKGAPDSSMLVSGIFDSTKVNVGDTLRITAWVYSTAGLIQDASTASDVYVTDKPVTVSMWVADRARSGDVATNGPAANYNDAKPVNELETATYTNITPGKWEEISLTYTVTEENKDVTGVSFNNDKMGSETVDAFPLYFYLAAVKVDKLVETEDAELGMITGTVKGDFAADGEADINVIVAAYEGTTFLGCDMLGYSSTNTYSFEISNAADADRVVAYVWDMTDIEPQTAPIVLTLAE
ncbi:MAG: hypothetical protein J6D26_04800 [Clostridia bacterium]|nr:hypothetical protein [Clostridia bacterium]